MDNIASDINRLGHIHPDRDSDLAIVVDTNKKVRGSKSLEWLRERAAIMEALMHKWEAIYGYGRKEHDGGRISSNHHVLMACSRSVYLINQRIKKIEQQNKAKSRLQSLRYKTAREIEALVQDGTMQKMRIEIEQLKATVAKQQSIGAIKEDAPERKEKYKEEYKQIFVQAEEEQNELVRQGNEMEELFGIKRNPEDSSDGSLS